MEKLLSTVLIASLIYACNFQTNHNDMNKIAEDYVKLVLEVGLYDPVIVDAYHGPDEWKPAPISDEKKQNFPMIGLIGSCDELINQLTYINENNLDNSEIMRKRFLEKHLIALRAKIRMIGGEKFSFKEEAKLLYDADLPGL
jgi:hypothetical protein